MTLEAERKRIFKDFMHVLEVGLRSQWKHRFSVSVHEDRRRNIPCFPPAAAARMPAPPLEDEEALQEVQEAPQEAIALSIGSSSPLSLLRQGRRRGQLGRSVSSYCGCCRRQGSESEEEEYHKKKKRSQSKSPSERSSSGESGEWLLRSERKEEKNKASDVKTRSRH